MAKARSDFQGSARRRKVLPLAPVQAQSLGSPRVSGLPGRATRTARKASRAGPGGGRGAPLGPGAPATFRLPAPTAQERDVASVAPEASATESPGRRRASAAAGAAGGAAAGSGLEPAASAAREEVGEGPAGRGEFPGSRCPTSSEAGGRDSGHPAPAGACRPLLPGSPRPRRRPDLTHPRRLAGALASRRLRLSRPQRPTGGRRSPARKGRARGCAEGGPGLRRRHSRDSARGK